MPTELITALDVDSREAALETVAACGPCQWFKIGSQLFTCCGPDIVQAVKEMGKKVFLDLKFHDIPNTVAQAARAAVGLGASMITVHACGGRKMITAAREAVEGSVTRVLAVTILTSLSDDELRGDIGLSESAAEAVPRYARMALDAGAHGIVASPQEIAVLRVVIGNEPLIVTPGIRPAWAARDDQARIMTPRQAAEAGANFVVVGRPILTHPDPADAVIKLLQELTV